MPPLLLQAPFIDRDNFGTFLNERGLKDTAVEVGTHRGAFAYQLLKRWEGRTLYCVDPWTNPPGYGPQAPYLEGGGKDRELDKAIAKHNLKEFGDRVRFRTTTSNKAVLDHEHESLDFVYVDGDHRRTAVVEDLEAWWAKVRPGGVLAGHDFVCPGEVIGGWSSTVQPAVMAFASKRGLDIWLVVETLSLPWSFYLKKPEQPCRTMT